MKAIDDTLINGKEIHLKVTDGQRQLNLTRCAEKLQNHQHALLEVRRDKEIKSARAISNSNNNITTNSNNTTTTSSNVNNSNNSTITTTTSTNNSGDSNCNNTHNININIFDAGLNSRQQGLSLQEFDNLFASQQNMLINDLHRQSLGMYQAHQHVKVKVINLWEYMVMQIPYIAIQLLACQCYRGRWARFPVWTLSSIYCTKILPSDAQVVAMLNGFYPSSRL